METKKIKQYINQNFDLPTLKKAGFIPKDVKLNDYEKIAELICRRFKLNNVYEYSLITGKYHLTYEQDCRPSWINEKGQYKTTPFVEKIGGNNE